MKVAAVDIGTNTVRLLLADAVTTADAVTLRDTERYEIITKLGEGLDATGRLGDEPMGRALAGLEKYRTIMESAGVVAAGGVATAATRSAANGVEFAQLVAAELGFAPRIIDGVEEARLTFLGATSHLGGSEVYCVIDVGGGSTEFVVGRCQPDYAVSVDIGSVRLTERVDSLQMAGLAEIRSYVDGLFFEVRPPQQATLVLGSGGTFVTLAAVARELPATDMNDQSDLVLSMAEVMATVDRLAAMSVDEIARLPSVAPGRADVLRAGVICAERALASVGATEVEISVSDLLDGIAMELGAVASTP